MEAHFGESLEAQPSRDCGLLPLPKGEGWGEGLQTIESPNPLTPSPRWGEGVPPCRAWSLCPSGALPKRKDLLLLLRRVLVVRDGCELDIVELAAYALDLADIDVLDHLARLRIERHWSARARKAQALHRIDQRGAVSRAVRLLERLIDHVHAVIGLHRHQVGTHAAVLFLELGDEGLVLGAVVRSRIMMRRDDAEPGVADLVDDVVLSQAAFGNELDARFVEAALNVLPHEGRPDAGRHEAEQRIGLGFCDALQERREIRIGERHPQ